MQIEISKLNKVLYDLDDFRYKNRSKILKTEIYKEIDPEGEQGESGLSFEVYPFPDVDGLFAKLRITTDSYGNNESVTGIQFVYQVKKKIQIYEKI